MTFYTYMWLREDGSPYYVGKGTGQRAYRKGCPPKERIVVLSWSDEAMAFAYEIYLIDFWGRQDLGTGILHNLTDGGEGAALSAESRQKISISLVGNQRHKGYPMPEAACRKISAANVGNLNGLGNTNTLGHRLSEDHKRKIGTFMKTNGKSFWPAARRIAQAERMRKVQRTRWA
jgi:hypothetical protein